MLIKVLIDETGREMEMWYVRRIAPVARMADNGDIAGWEYLA